MTGGVSESLRVQEALLDWLSAEAGIDYDVLEAEVRPQLTALRAAVREQIAREIEAEAPAPGEFGNDSYGQNLARLLNEHYGIAARIARGGS